MGWVAVLTKRIVTIEGTNAKCNVKCNEKETTGCYAQRQTEQVNSVGLLSSGRKSRVRGAKERRFSIREIEREVAA